MAMLFSYVKIIESVRHYGLRVQPRVMAVAKVSQSLLSCQNLEVSSFDIN